MNPDDSVEADEALGRIRDLCQKLEARDKDDLDEVIETTGKAVEEKALRFGRGARVVCNTGRNSEEPWEAGTVVALYHREEGWAPGEVVPYQVRLNDGTLIYAPFDADGCIRLRSGDDLDVDVVVVGAGAAGIGCAVSLTRAFGLDPARVRILERSKTVGASFRAWPKEMRFISPSFNQQGWTDSFDLNAVAQDTSPAYALHAQHPSGSQYADYLAALADDASLDIRLGTEVRRVEKLADGDFDVHVRAGGADNTIRTRFVVWAAGEFQYPSTSDIPGAAEHCIHNSKVESWAGLPGDERVVIGGYESGVDACVNLARAGKKVTVLASTPTWNVQTPDPSTELAPYTAERLREVMSPGFPGPTPELLAPLRVLRVEEASEGGGFNVVAAWKKQDKPLRPEGSLRTPFEGAAPPGAEGSELVVHTAQPPVLCTGFEGSVAAVAQNLFDLADGSGKGCLAGAPLLTAEDESTKTPGVFLVGPTVVQGELSFCFVYKFRQRFGIVADAISRGLGRDTRESVQGLRQANMYMNDLSCCENTCGEVC